MIIWKPFRVAATGEDVGVTSVVGTAEAEGDSLGVGEAVGVVAAGLGEVSAVSKNQMGTRTRIRGKRMKPGNDTRGRLVTPAATGSTTLRSALGSATEVGEHRGGVAAAHAARPG